MEILLSICIPTYNRADIVYKCVASCLQIEADWIEVAITDNCSTDNTQKVLSEIMDERFRYYRNNENIGYQNLMVCMKNGSGKYCLLLSDEDELIEFDVASLKTFLESNEKISVFQFNYYDEKGNLIVGASKEVLEKNTIEAYSYCRNYFSYAGGMLLKHSDLLDVWDVIKKPELLWSLYCETLVPLYCAGKGAVAHLPYLSSKRTERNNTGELDVNAWEGKGSKGEPYWSLKSRYQQYVDWYEVILSMQLDNKCKVNLLYENRNDCLRAAGNYYDLIHNEVILKEPILKKRWDVVERDRKLKFQNWYKIVKKAKKETKQQFGKIRKSVYVSKDIAFKQAFIGEYLYRWNLLVILLKCIKNHEI